MKKALSVVERAFNKEDNIKKPLHVVTIFVLLNLQYLCAIVDIKMAEEEGFEPPRGVNPLAVFKTAPFSQTWVLLRVTDNEYNIMLVLYRQ
jgi:hypothetical protein